MNIKVVNDIFRLQGCSGHPCHECGDQHGFYDNATNIRFYPHFIGKNAVFHLICKHEFFSTPFQPKPVTEEMYFCMQLIPLNGDYVSEFIREWWDRPT